MLDLEFMRLAFAAGAVVGVLAPTVGFFIVQREMSLIGDGIGHVAFAGVAAGYLLGISPVWTALVAAMLGAGGIEWLRARRRAAGDQALAIVFYTGIALGVVLISAAGALNANLFAYLFGSILTVTRTDLVVIASLGLGALVLVAVLLRGLIAVALDEEGARVAGLPVPLLNGLISMLAALTIGVSMRIVGILLIAALMVLPVIAANRIAWSLLSTFGLSVAIGLASVFAGLTLSYYADLAPGGTIVLVAAAAFVLGTLGLVATALALVGPALGWLRFVPGLVAFVLFALGGMGGGDVKILAAVGTAAGAVAATEALILGFLFGAFYGLCKLAWKGVLFASLWRMFRFMIGAIVPGVPRIKLIREGENPTLERFAVAVCLGVLATLWDLRTGGISSWVLGT